MERRFKSEREKIEYYKKLKVKENNVAQKNMDAITEAYHEIEFGVVPEVADNRSLAEKIADERGQQQEAHKNALTLMANDGEEANKLYNLIGSSRNQEFKKPNNQNICLVFTERILYCWGISNTYDV